MKMDNKSTIYKFNYLKHIKFNILKREGQMYRLRLIIIIITIKIKVIHQDQGQIKVEGQHVHVNQEK
jgi:hypothetical protein